MKIAIWGAGAVGLGLASTLARSRETLTLIGRDPEALETLGTRGIVRTGLFGEARVGREQLSIETRIDALREDPPDWLLVCTKACAVAEIARSLAPVASDLLPKTRLLICQNGWGTEAPFLEFWPRELIFHARIITGFHRRRPNEVEITAHAAPILLGSLFGAEIGELEALATRMSEGGIPTETTEDMRGVLWAKMLYNCGLNPLGALTGRRYGELVDDPTTRVLLEKVVHETFLVLEAEGVELVWASADAYLDTFYAELIPPTAAHESSMLQDLRAGRQTEIEALNGAVEQLGRKHDIATPVTSALATILRVAEGAGAKLGSPTSDTTQT